MPRADQSLLHDTTRRSIGSNGRASYDRHWAHLSKAFAELVDDMRHLDYFPKVLSKGCVDDGVTWEDFTRAASAEISKADPR